MAFCGVHPRAYFTPKLFFDTKRGKGSSTRTERRRRRDVGWVRRPGSRWARSLSF